MQPKLRALVCDVIQSVHAEPAGNVAAKCIFFVSQIASLTKLEKLYESDSKLHPHIKINFKFKLQNVSMVEPR